MTKLVSLSNEAYSTLKKMKGKSMSFSDIILKLVNSTKHEHNFLKFAGALKSESKELEEFKKRVSIDRAKNIDRV